MIEHEQIAQLLRINRLAEASELIRHGFTQHPDDPTLHYYAAQVAWSNDDKPSAEEHLAQALASSPHHVAARELRFRLLMDNQEYPEAERVVVDLLREDPDNAEFLALYARLMMHTLHLAKAEALVREALRRDPESQSARLVRVLLAATRGDDQQARSALAELIHEDPNALSVGYTVLQLLVHERRHREALQLGRELLHVDPTNEALVEALIELRAATHWVALPAYPLVRWGWLASGVMWFGAVVALRVVRGSPAGAAFSIVWLSYVVYSWVHGPFLKRWIRWRGF